MAKQSGGLLAFSASGTIAKTLVYSSWRGRPYTRRHVIPANPQTTAQTETRTTFSFLSALFKEGGSGFSFPWQLYASGQALTDRNAFMKFNISNLRLATDLADLILSPGAKGGLPLVSMTVTPGSGQLTLAVTAPVLPPDWVLDEMDGFAVLDQDPHLPTDFRMFSGFDLTSPYSIVIPGLTAGSLYRVFAIAQYHKPNGDRATSPQLAGSGTPT